MHAWGRALEEEEVVVVLGLQASGFRLQGWHGTAAEGGSSVRSSHRDTSSCLVALVGPCPLKHMREARSEQLPVAI
jgi:hypothetical protein